MKTHATKFHNAETTSINSTENGIVTGFPSPAGDYSGVAIDLNRELVAHPAATFFARMQGDSMANEGISHGDLLVVDKSVTPENGDLAVCCLNGEFLLKRLHYISNYRLILLSANPRFRPIEVTHDSSFFVWGIVLHTIKSNRKLKKFHKQIPWLV